MSQTWGAAAALCLLGATPLAAQSVLTGTVREDSTGRPMAGVEVLVAGSLLRTTTDAGGRYILRGLPNGRRLALFRSVGFRPAQEWVVIGAADTIWDNPTMVRQSFQLDPLVVTAAPKAPRGVGIEAFEERRRMGFGKFIDSTTLRRNEHVPLVELLGRLQGIGFTKIAGGIAAVSQRRFGPMGEPCFMAVVLDGSVLYSSKAPGLGGGGEGKPPMDLSMFDTASIEAVEVYRGAAEVPIEFGGAGSACGVVVLWTRQP